MLLVVSAEPSHLPHRNFAAIALLRACWLPHRLGEVEAAKAAAATAAAAAATRADAELGAVQVAAAKTLEAERAKCTAVTATCTELRASLAQASARVAELQTRTEKAEARAVGLERELQAAGEEHGAREQAAVAASVRVHTTRHMRSVVYSGSVGARRHDDQCQSCITVVAGDGCVHACI